MTERNSLFEQEIDYISPKDVPYFVRVIAHAKAIGIEKEGLASIFAEHLNHEERREYAIAYLTERGKI